jgi:hypothetical protein
MSIALLTKMPDFLDSEDKLVNFVATMPFSAHLRDIKTDKFILANNEQAKNHGLKQANDIIGKTTRDCYAMSKINAARLQASIPLVEKNYMLFKAANFQVEQEKQSITFLENTLAGSGFIFTGKIFKYPLLNQQGKTMAVFTFAIETTKGLDLSIVYRLYKEYFPKKIAVQQILTYLQIASYFTQAPTDMELTVLLKMREISAHKSLAQALHVKLVTIESHLQHLREKLIGINLDQLLTHLRNFHYIELSF